MMMKGEERTPAHEQSAWYAEHLQFQPRADHLLALGLACAEAQRHCPAGRQHHPKNPICLHPTPTLTQEICRHAAHLAAFSAERHADALSHASQFQFRARIPF
eukprot:1150175-Pelagomonas_calceolata.AAC.2